MAISSSATRSAASTLAKLGITDFWRWWTGELRHVFQPWSARWLHNEEDVSELVCDGSFLTFSPRGSVVAAASGVAAGIVPIDRIEMKNAHGAALTADELKRAVLAALSGRAKDVNLLIAPQLALQKHVTYPAATMENLRDVVSFDMDRQTPFNASQVYFDARRAHMTSTVGSNSGSEDNPMVGVDLLAVPRQALQTALLALREAGASLRSMGIVGDSGSPRFELLPLAEKPARRLTRLQIINVVLLGFAAVLLLGAIIVPIWQKREQAIALQPLLQKAQTEAEITKKVEAEFTRLSQEYNFAVGKKYTVQPALEIVEELSKISPDTTWIQTLEIKTLANKSGPAVREVQLMGEAASASKMIELLEQSKLLQNASQRAQTTRGSQPNLERFQIATELKPRTLPAFATLIAPKVPPVAEFEPASAAKPTASPNQATAAGSAAANTNASTPTTGNTDAHNTANKTASVAASAPAPLKPASPKPAQTTQPTPVYVSPPATLTGAPPALPPPLPAPSTPFPGLPPPHSVEPHAPSGARSAISPSPAPSASTYLSRKVS